MALFNFIDIPRASLIYLFERGYFDDSISFSRAGSAFVKNQFNEEVEVQEDIPKLTYVNEGDVPCLLVEAADNCLVEPDEFLEGYKASIGAAVVAKFAFMPSENPQVVYELNDGTANNKITLLRDVNNTLRFIFTESGSESLNMTVGDAEDMIITEVSFSFKDGSVRASLNGGDIVLDTTVNVPPVDRMLIGKGDSGSPINGFLFSIKGYPKPVSDEDMKILADSQPVAISYDGITGGGYGDYNSNDFLLFDLTSTNNFELLELN